MNKKIKIIILFLILIILVVILKNLFKVNSLNYVINNNGNKFNIKEVYKNKNYYIEIKTKTNIFPIRIYEDIKNKKIIKKIYYYYDDNYECLLPIINNKLNIDMMCYKENILYNYNDIIGENSDLDEYVKNIKEYNIEQFKNNISEYNKINTIKYYNSIEKKVVLTTYKGLNISGSEVNIFNKDIYNNKISTFLDNYYIIADYNNDYEFKYFYVVNLENNELFKIKSKYIISLDSYIQGIVDKKIYLYDKDNENQYEIDINKKTIKLISNTKYIKYYSNNKWEKLNKISANKEVYFNYESLNNYFTKYNQVIDSTNYYYLLKDNGKNYDLYRVDKENINIYKFISEIPTDKIYTNNDYIYYSYDNKIYYYSDKTGLKLLLEDSELEFNNTIKYYIY